MKHILIYSILFLLLPAFGAERPFLEWQSLPPLPPAPGDSVQPGLAGPFAGISNDVLIVAGGANFPSPEWETEKVYHRQIYVLEHTADADALHWITGIELDYPLAYGASVSTAWGVVCMGGMDEAKVYADVFLLTWNRDGRALEKRNLPPLPFPCAHGYATFINNKIYLAGGQSGTGLETAMQNFWVLDFTSYSGNDAVSPDSGETLAVQGWGDFRWQELPSWPGPERAFNITVAQHDGSSDHVYVISGRRFIPGMTNPSVFDFLQDVYAFSPDKYGRISDSESPWKRCADIPACVMAGTGAAMGQSHIFIFGGADGSLVHHVDELKDRHPGFPKKVRAYHTITDTWIDAGISPANQVTTVAVPWNERIIIPTGEVRPRHRTPEIWQVGVSGQTDAFGVVNFVMLTVYLLGMVAIGFYFAGKNKNTNDYFRGGQHIPWWAAGCSIFATMLSSITYMSVPAKAYADNWEYLLGYPAIFIVAVFVIYLVLPYFRKIDATSAYEYLEQRFNRTTRLIGSGLFTLFQVGRMAIVMYLSALALSAITPFSEAEAVLIMGVLSLIYSTLGGVEAVIWTDTIQTFILLGGALLIMGITLFQIDGGIGAAFSTALADHKFHMVNWDWSWSSYTTAAFWVLIVGSLAQNLISYSSDQAVVQRYMTTASEKLAARSILSNGIMSLFAGLLFFALGTVLYLFYKTHPAQLDPSFKNDAIMPLFIIRELPVGVAGLIVAGIFAAAQSTISTSMNSTASVVVTDFIRPFSRKTDDRHFLNLGRLFTVVLGLAGTITAIVFSSGDIKSLLEYFFTIIGLFGGSLGGLFLLGMFTKRANGPGAVTGALIGAAVLYLVKTHTETHLYLYGFVGMVSCFIAGYIASITFTLYGFITSNARH